MTQTIAAAHRMWWDSEEPAVRAVLDLAWMRPDASPDCHDRIVALLAPQHADEIRQISSWIAAADADDCGLRDHDVCSIESAELEVERLRDDALRSAQLVASLILAGRAT
jgi:hypothetical protein